MILDDIQSQRHWAETVRLYAGWLDNYERNNFIKDLSYKNILLAAECRANIFTEDVLLDKFLAEEALKNAENTEKTKVSSEGFLALAVLEKYDIILKVFKSIKLNNNKPHYQTVVRDLIKNGTESQVIEFLKILASSKKSLLELACDSILENFIVLTPDTKATGLEILELINKNSYDNKILRLKIICIFQLASEIDDPKTALYMLLNRKNIKYAFRLTALHKFSVDKTILPYIDNFHNSYNLVKFFLNILNNLDLNFDKELINLILAKNLNPLIKKLALTNVDGIPIDKEMAIKICEINIKFGTKSSIEFINEVSEIYNLEALYSKDFLILALLKTHKIQSIELAYRYIKENSLYNKFDFRTLFHLLVGDFNNESLQFARKIILEEFPIEEQNNMLTFIAALSLKDKKLIKLSKLIILDDLNALNADFSSSKELNGYIVNFFKGSYQVQYSKNHPPLRISSKRKLKIGSFVRLIPNFRTSSKSIVDFEKINPILLKYQDIWYNNYHEGQILTIKIINVEGKRALGIDLNNSKSLNFVIPISEISFGYINCLHDEIKENNFYQVRIKHFNKRKNIAVCSIKDLTLDEQKKMVDKLELLRTKFNN